MKKILVTCALPYANGPIHLGHLLEHIQADIWVRYQRMKGNLVYFICADDTHGTAIMLKAKKIGVSPNKMIKQINLEHKNDLCNFNIKYDVYHTTDSKENKYFSYMIYKRLCKNGFIKEKIITQLFDVKEKIFLPDRFVSGNCPKCKSLNQYGDNCSKCGFIYNSIDLINPKSIISGTVPIIKKSKHLFFNLPVFKNILEKWINSGVLHKSISNKMKEWLKSGLKMWNISRDSPYFGFKIPNYPEKYFYVWLDAPIAYISSFKYLCKKKKNINFNEFWDINSSADLCHFIGKDIIYFHSLFWPAILLGSNFRTPTKIFVHGYLTVNGYKMSKSKGTFIKASTYLKYFDPDCLRYYYASKLSSNINDIDLNLEDFVKKFNSDIVNKIINLASRSSSFINKLFDNYLSSKLEDLDLHNTFINFSFEISKEFNNRNTNRVIEIIIYLSNLANKYIDRRSPWKISLNVNKRKELHDICTMGIELFRILMIYLKPILPSLSIRVESFLLTKLNWENLNKTLCGCRINKFNNLFNRLSKEKVNFLLKK